MARKMTKKELLEFYMAEYERKHPEKRLDLAKATPAYMTGSFLFARPEKAQEKEERGNGKN